MNALNTATVAAPAAQTADAAPVPGAMARDEDSSSAPFSSLLQEQDDAPELLPLPLPRALPLGALGLLGQSLLSDPQSQATPDAAALPVLPGTPAKPKEGEDALLILASSMQLTGLTLPVPPTPLPVPTLPTGTVAEGTDGASVQTSTNGNAVAPGASFQGKEPRPASTQPLPQVGAFTLPTPAAPVAPGKPETARSAAPAVAPQSFAPLPEAVTPSQPVSAPTELPDASDLTAAMSLPPSVEVTSFNFTPADTTTAPALGSIPVTPGSIVQQVAKALASTQPTPAAQVSTVAASPTEPAMTPSTPAPVVTDTTPAQATSSPEAKATAPDAAPTPTTTPNPATVAVATTPAAVTVAAAIAAAAPAPALGKNSTASFASDDQGMPPVRDSAQLRMRLPAANQHVTPVGTPSAKASPVMRANLFNHAALPESPDDKAGFKPFVLPSPEPAETNAQPSNIIPATFAPGREMAPAEVSSPLLTHRSAAEMVNLLHEVTQAANVVRPGRVELEVKLDGGSQLHIKIDWVDGQLKMTFRSPSESLRSALESAWPTFKQEASSTGLPVAEVRFEGGAASNNSFSDHSSSRGDRQQAEAATPWGEQLPADRRSRDRREQRSSRSLNEDATVWA